MRLYRDFILNAPDDINGFFAFLVVPPAPPFPEHLHLKKMCGIVWCCTGSPEKAEEALKPLTSFGPPAFTFRALCRIQACRACSTHSIPRDFSGTGRRTSSMKSPTRPSPSMYGTAPRFPPCIPLCTCTRSMEPPAVLERTIQHGAIANRTGLRSSLVWIPIRLTTTS